MRKSSIKNIIKKIMLPAFVLTALFIKVPEQASADVKIYKGEVSVTDFITYKGQTAAVINLNTDNIMIDDVELENEPWYLDEDYDPVNNRVIIYGLKDGVTYSNLYLEVDIEDRYGDQDHYYKITPFSTSGSSASGQSSNSQTSTSVPSNTSSSVQNRQGIQEYLKTVYKNVFGRDVDQQGLNFWAERLGNHSTKLEDFFKNLLSENEFLTIAPTVEDKIKKLYQGIFQRQPDTQGFNYWVNEYREELRDGDSEREALRDVIDDMTDGPEFKAILQKLGLRG